MKRRNFLIWGLAAVLLLCPLFYKPDLPDAILADALEGMATPSNAEEREGEVLEPDEVVEEPEANEVIEEVPVTSEEPELEEIIEESEDPAPVTFTVNTANTPASRTNGVHYQSSFPAEAVFEYNGIRYEGLLSECWDLAVTHKAGVITLISDVTAHAYDPAVYSGTSYTENGITREGAPHAVTRFTGGLKSLYVGEGMNVTLDLNGYVLDRNMKEADGTADRAYTVEVAAGGLFTLTDCKGTGKLTGGYGDGCVCDHAYGSCVIVHKDGTFTLSGAEISGNIGNGAVTGEGRVVLEGNARIMGNADHNGKAKNLLVSGSMDVSGEGLTDKAAIGLTAEAGRNENAVYMPDGNLDLFTSDAGLGVSQDGNYIIVGEAAECPYEAEFHEHTGAVYTGTFAEMFARMAAGHTGTLKIMKDIEVSGTYVWNVWGSAVIDFNGHRVKARGTSSQNFLTVGAGATSGITLTDSTGRVRQTARRVDAAGEPSWDPASKTYTYYTAYAADGGTDTGMILVIDEITADFSRLGGLDVSGYNRAVMASHSTITVAGGAHRSDNGFLQAASGTANVRTTGGYVFDSSSRDVTSGGAFYLQNAQSFTMTGGIIAGCEAKQGGAIRADNVSSFTMTGGTIAQCYGAYNGGALYLSNGCQNPKIGGALFALNGSGERGGAVMCSIPHTEFTDVIFAGNKGVTGGAVAIYANNGSASLTDCMVIGNEAQRGGGFAQEANTTVTLNLSSTMVTKNKGGGIRFDKGAFTLKEGTFAEQNEGGNLILGTGAVIRLSGLTESSQIKAGVTTADLPAPGQDVLFANGALGCDASSFFYSDAGYKIVQADDQAFLSVNEVQEFDGVLMQYFAHLTRVDYGSDKGQELQLIDTSGKQLPVNNNTPNLTHLAVDEAGNVITREILTRMYADKNLEAGAVDIDAMNRFYRENYRMLEVWTGTDPSSFDRDDFTIVPYEKGMVIDVTDGTVVRIVAEQTDGTWESEVVFYDYDIMDGGWYASQEDAAAGINQRLSSEQPEETSTVKSWINTKHFGINDPDNGTGNGTRLVFGNNNMLVDEDDAVWESPTGRININRFNRATNGVLGTFAGASYGIPSHLDENGWIVYSDGLDVPALFNWDMAVGKSTYTDYGFSFIRRGDTFTLSSVTGTGLSDLEKFHNPGIYDGVQHPTKIWSNGFWPMDYAPSFGGDGHDIKFGSAKRNANGQVILGGTADAKAAPADAGLDHNGYFGFQLNIAFTMPEHYRGPMDYVFFGDDDIWVFLDGQLVCDIGGIHSAIGEYVNLWDYLEEDDTSEHQLAIFYTERGASGSTCWMRFNLPNIVSQTEIPVVFEHSFEKVDGDGRLLPGVWFGLYKDEACIAEKAQSVSNKDGRVTFSGLIDGNTYYVKETKPLPGYKGDDKTYVLAQDADGSWRMYRLGDITKRSVTRIVNKSGSQMPETGRKDALYLMVFGLLAITGGLILMKIIKRREKHV